MTDYEFYPTPDPFTHWLFDEVPIRGRVLEPCVGDGAIVRSAGANQPGFEPCREWFTNDLDSRWSTADSHLDASTPALRNALTALGITIDWSVSNPPFTPAVEIIEEQLAIARVGVAMHLRASIHEVLKTGVRRTWLSQRPPTGILWLPRFAYQRSKAKGEWSTDSVTACWVIWLKDPAAAQFIKYAPERVLDELKVFTPAYRQRMDTLMLELDPAGYADLLRKAA